MVKTIRYFLLGEAAAFICAALVHGGVLVTGYEHREAQIAESAIALALLLGLASTWIWPLRTATAGLVAQGFALFWTLVGVFTIAIGVGPRTLGDVVYHAAIVIVLLFGLVAASRARFERTTMRA
jgi:hypothetical protein